MKTYINNQPHEMLASVRPAGSPFQDQDGSLVGLDLSYYDGTGECNVRMTVEQADALRQALNQYLDTPHKHAVTVAKNNKGKIIEHHSGL